MNDNETKVWKYERVKTLSPADCMLSNDRGNSFLSMNDDGLPLVFDNPLMARMYICDMEENGSDVDYSEFEPFKPKMLIFAGKNPAYYKMRPIVAVCSHCGRLLFDADKTSLTYKCFICGAEVSLKNAVSQ